jgi:hypothetical protein
MLVMVPISQHFVEQKLQIDVEYEHAKNENENDHIDHVDDIDEFGLVVVLVAVDEDFFLIRIDLI